MPDDLEVRLLRRFIVVAEELHFGRAAQRLYVAQQALSRDMQRLEARVGVALLDRTTRRVALTPAGATLLARARELVALHDVMLREVREDSDALTVDVVGPDLTPSLVLAHARRRAPEVEYFGRFHAGDEPAAALVRDGELDVTFGRVLGPPDGVEQHLVRYEPLTVLVPEHSSLARLSAIPVATLRDTVPCYRTGDQATPGWDDAIRQLLAGFGVESAAHHPRLRGTDELAQHIKCARSRCSPWPANLPCPAQYCCPWSHPSHSFPGPCCIGGDQEIPGSRHCSTPSDRWRRPMTGACCPPTTGYRIRNHARVEPEVARTDTFSLGWGKS